jgi:glycosyltransferase involved in cell wall biosynthesis
MPNPEDIQLAGEHGGARAHDLRRRDGSPAVVVFLVTEDWYFWSHRVNIARAARDAGARVVVATRVGAHAEAIRGERFELIAIPWRRRTTDAIREARAWLAIRSLYARLQPDLVHHVAIKPVVYGGLAARLSGSPRHVNAIAGLGYIETSRHARARLLRPLFNAVLRFAWRPSNVHAIVQNPEDAALLAARFLPRERVHMIRGSGVDVARFAPGPEPSLQHGLVATYVGRLLWSKGVGEIVEASRILRARGTRVVMRLVGEPDPENPESIPEAMLRQWVTDGLVKWEVWTDDVPAVWRTSHVAVLPSYREGLPKALLEAAAAGRAMVASDVPGCREIARESVNALLVPPRDARAIADAIERLARDDELRRRLGAAAREIAEREFAEPLVVAETLSLYQRIIGDA